MRIGRFSINNIGDVIKLRNLVVYKAMGNSSRINGFINYNRSSRHGGRLRNRLSYEIIKEFTATDAIRFEAEMTLRGRFNILGTGWIEWGNKNGIEWDKDPKSGFKWSKEYIDEHDYLNTPEGVDIKMCWEMGRMNYLMPLSIYAVSAIEQIDLVIKKYKEIILGFIKNNPTGRGVNWILPMEAAIRISNIIFSYDILTQISDSLYCDEEFANTISSITWQHMKFIWNNLEKNIVTDVNGNHYYSNIIGLLLCTSYLHKSSYVKKIYNFAKREFFRETCKQFYLTGGHIEGSSGYFRLVAEMAVIGVALLLSNDEFIPEEVVRRVYENEVFAENLQKPSGRYYVFGDCDSSRFIKSSLHGEWTNSGKMNEKYQGFCRYVKRYGDDETYLLEDVNDLSSLILYTKALFQDVDEANYNIDVMFIKSILGNKTLSKKYEWRNKDNLSIRGEQKDKIDKIRRDSLIYKKHKEIMIERKYIKEYLNSEAGVYTATMGDTGLFFYLGCNHALGHSHNDSMHYEYEINGESFYADRGTYTYTGYPQLRNIFRSQNAHNVPRYIIEQKEFKGFFAYNSGDCRVINYRGKGSIGVFYTNGGYTHYREVNIKNDKIIITDEGSLDFDNSGYTNVPYSPSYGIIKKLND